MRPLDRIRSIKVKLGLVIVAAVVVSAATAIGGVRAGLPLLVCAAIAAVLTLGLVQVFARGMTSPLRALARAARAMERGDYDVRVNASSRDEVGELARAFNAMARELGDVDRTRRELIANVSHELRTPLSALHALLENLVDGVEPPEPAALQTALAQTERLGRMVSQLLDLSKLDAGSLPLELRDCRLRPVLDGAVAELRLGPTGAARRAVSLRVSVEPPTLAAHADPERLHQVVANLLDNAVRHSPDGGLVELSAGRQRDGVEIRVSDQGAGIAADDADRIFERFHQAGGVRGSGGSGLGLAIARSIVDAHGGAIRAENLNGDGCRMVVVLPAARA